LDPLKEVVAGNVQDGVVKLLQSPMFQLVYTGSSDGKVRAWDGRTRNCECTYEGHKESILDIGSTKCGFLSPMAFSSSGVKVPSKSQEQTTVHFHYGGSEVDL